MSALISPLACGIRGAEGGYAQIKSRGASTDSACYSTYDSTKNIVGNHTLDANGAVVRYCTEPVDVYVYKSDGELLRTFTWQTEAGSTAVKQTGYNSGNFTTLETVLTDMYNSFGAADGKVLVNGAATNLKDALITPGVFYNVKNTTYGAKGDGTTDDAGAIQLAINAAEAAGGGVVIVPSGTYNISTALVIDSAGVTLQGIGDPMIRSTVANANGITVTSAARTKLTGFRIQVADSVGADSTGYAISLASSDNCVVSEVSCDAEGTYNFARSINASSCSGLILSRLKLAEDLVTSSCDTMRMSDCDLGLVSLSGGSQNTITNCVFNQSSTFASMIGLVEAGNSFYDQAINDGVTITGYERTQRFLSFVGMIHGTDVASANDLPLPSLGACYIYRVTGTTTINGLATTSARQGDRVTLIFAGTLTLTHNGSPSAGFAKLLLAKGSNDTTAAGTVLTFTYVTGSGWVEDTQTV